MTPGIPGASEQDGHREAPRDELIPMRRRLPDREILNIDEAALLLGVSVKTFNKVLHTEDMPARKIGREWKFSRQALIDWVGSGRSRAFYRDSNDVEEGEEIAEQERPKSRRTAGWHIEMD